MFGIFRRKKKLATNQVAAEPVIPQFEEVFEVIATVFNSDPMEGAFDVKVDETSLRSVSLALCQGLREYLPRSEEHTSELQSH